MKVVSLYHIGMGTEERIVRGDQSRSLCCYRWPDQTAMKGKRHGCRALSTVSGAQRCGKERTGKNGSGSLHRFFSVRRGKGAVGSSVPRKRGLRGPDTP